MKIGDKDIDNLYELESYVLGAMILDNNCIAEVMGLLEDYHWSSHHHGVVFDAIYSIYIDSMPLDLVGVRNVLRKSGVLDRIGGVSYLVHLVDNISSADKAVACAKTLRELVEKVEAATAQALGFKV